ncbi:DUF6166 domain-containing protein [Methylophaga sp.]|uniref:DUF6166 domain-containing protein n=1 Tax=Methylophaga sp. TaxID=2024840 RepID=UPI003A8EC987
MAGRPPKEATRLPTWEIRLEAWTSALKQEFCSSQGLSDLEAVADIELFNFIYARVDDGLSDSSTFNRWINKKSDPPRKKRLQLSYAEPFSGQFLVPDHSFIGIPALLTALDCYLCARSAELRPSLLAPDDQERLTERCLSEIAKKWQIPFVYEGEKTWQKDFAVNDISLSLLCTHSVSAIPMFLCSSVTDKILRDESALCDWYLDIMISTLFVSARLHQNIFDDPHRDLTEAEYRRFHSEYKNLVGTPSNLLRFLGLLISAEFPIGSGAMALACVSNDIVEVEEPEKLLIAVLGGYEKLSNEFEKLGFSWGDLAKVVAKTLKLADPIMNVFLPLVHIEPISVQHYRYYEKTKINLNTLVLYHLDTEDGISLKRQLIHDSGYVSNKTSLSQKLGLWGDPSKILCDPHNDSEFAWGYGGRGPYQLAYTMLKDLFKTAGVSEEVEFYHCEIVVYRLLSRFPGNVSYTVSSRQLLHVLGKPLVSEKDRMQSISSSMNRFLLKGCVFSSSGT